MKKMILPLVAFLSACSFIGNEPPKIKSTHVPETDLEYVYYNYDIYSQDFTADRNVLGIAEAIKDTVKTLQAQKNSEYKNIKYVDFNFRLVNPNKPSETLDYAEFVIPYNTAMHANISKDKPVDYLDMENDFWFKDEMSNVVVESFCADLRFGPSRFCNLVDAGV